MAPLPTPSPRTGPPSTPQASAGAATPFRTPTSKHRLHFPPGTPRHGATGAATEHPVEVIGRVRNLTASAAGASVLEVPGGAGGGGTTVRVRGDAGGISCRDFSLDGVSVSEEEDLEGFYRRFVRSRIQGVRVGAKCTVMVYGPTGSGKSHTMFGCAKQPGIVYRALRDILDGGGGCSTGGESGEEEDAGFGVGLFVQVAVLEIYNEEIYDLLVGSGANTKGNAPKVRLEVMGKKAKNATYISGNEAGKISREVAKVEKRRTVKSTLCNERSSRSHCMIILDVPSVGGRLMLVDMAGSENIEAAGQTGFDAKMQTAKINQGNTALKRVVESIANGDSHVPFRDSKLTMLLQDSFEDDKSKILMILCASPDPKELHKTVSTLEYGAKAKCIIRAAHASTPRDKISSEESSSMLNSRIVAMNQFIYKLQKENKQREKERNEAQNVLRLKEEELAQVRAKVRLLEGQGAAAKEEEINSKVAEKTKMLKSELQMMEEKMLRQQQELLALKRRLQEVELEKADARQPAQQDVIGGRLLARLSEMSAGGDQCMSMAMSMSMDLDAGDQPSVLDVKVIKEDTRQQQGQMWNHTSTAGSCTTVLEQEDVVRLSGFPEKAVLSTVFEEGDEESEEKDNGAEVEVCKEVVEEESYKVDRMGQPLAEPDRTNRIQNIFRLCGNYRELVKKQNAQESPAAKQQAFGDENKQPGEQQLPGDENIQQANQVFGDENKDPSAAWAAIETPMCDVKVADSPVSSQLSPIVCQAVDDAELTMPEELKSCTTDGEANELSKEREGLLDVYIKWESGSLIKGLKLLPTACLSDLRKLIEAHFEEAGSKQQHHQFTFLLLGDPSGAPVSREKEATVQISRLPNWNNQTNSYLACLRVAKKPAAMEQQQLHQTPFSPLESKLNSLALHEVQQHHHAAAGALSPKVAAQMSPSYIRELRA
ncbi:kinesin-like protein KIN-10A [Triticum urartu]|uniref:kinesin-like protein KIN-10A n=1 Tax=Triticum urartu TaxID=4572 RepID=UPI002043F57C|nr:kinesin-like protein KIN-10A [Triticum urartu]